VWANYNSLFILENGPHTCATDVYKCVQIRRLVTVLLVSFSHNTETRSMEAQEVFKDQSLFLP
jgi:hypothetical protein